MKSNQTYHFILLLVCIVTTRTIGQEATQSNQSVNSFEYGVDSLLIKKDTSKQLKIYNNKITIGTSTSSFSDSETSVSTYRTNWDASISDRWAFNIYVNHLRSTKNQEWSYGVQLKYILPKFGLIMGTQLIKNPLGPNNISTLSGYVYLNQKLILSSQIQRIEFDNSQPIWPFQLKSSYITGRIGWSIGVTQDINNLQSIALIKNFGITYESPKSDILSIYFVSGPLIQPQFAFRLIENSAKQISLGTWFRKKIFESTSIIGGIGFLTIENVTAPSIRSIQSQISLSIQL